MVVYWSKAETWGALGDSVAPFTGLLTAAALFGALWSVRLQRQELALQREEMRAQREEMAEQRDQLARTAKAQEALAGAQKGLALATCLGVLAQVVKAKEMAEAFTRNVAPLEPGHIALSQAMSRLVAATERCLNELDPEAAAEIGPAESLGVLWRPEATGGRE